MLFRKFTSTKAVVKILIVEDDISWAHIIREYVQGNINFTHITTLDSAEHLFECNCYDLIISDLILTPDKYNLHDDIVRLIKLTNWDKKPKPPIIIITGHERMASESLAQEYQERIWAWHNKMNFDGEQLNKDIKEALTTTRSSNFEEQRSNLVDLKILLLAIIRFFKIRSKL